VGVAHFEVVWWPDLDRSPLHRVHACVAARMRGEVAWFCHHHCHHLHAEHVQAHPLSDFSHAVPPFSEHC